MMGEVIDSMEYKLKRSAKKAELPSEHEGFHTLDDFLDVIHKRVDAFNADTTLQDETAITLSIYDWAQLADQIVDLLDGNDRSLHGGGAA